MNHAEKAVMVPEGIIRGPFDREDTQPKKSEDNTCSI